MVKIFIIRNKAEADDILAKNTVLELPCYPAESVHKNPYIDEVRQYDAQSADIGHRS